MIEGTVEVTGAVKIDESDKVRNLITLANRARDEDNAAEAKKYYEMILVEDPDNWEANYYSSYYALMDGSVAKLPDNLRLFRNRANTALKIIMKNEKRSSGADDFFKQTSHVYEVVSNHVNKRQKELTQEMISAGMKMLTSGNSSLLDSVTEKVKKEQIELFRIMGYIQDSITDIVEIVEEHGFSKDNKEFKGLLKTCDNAYAVDVRKIIEIKDYKGYIEKLLRYVDVLNSVMSEYSSVALNALKDQAGLIASDKDNATIGREMLKIVDEWEKEAKQKKRVKYWEEHQEEKQKYDARIKELNDECAPLESIIIDYEKQRKGAESQFLEAKDALDSETKQLRDQIYDIENKMRGLGLFSRKEKRTLQDQKDNLSRKLSDLERVNQGKEASLRKERDERIAQIKENATPIKEKLEALQKEKKKIEEELSKDR